MRRRPGIVRHQGMGARRSEIWSRSMRTDTSEANENDTLTGIRQLIAHPPTRVHYESNKRSRESAKCSRVLSMPRSSIELPYVPSLSRRRHGFDSRTGRQFPQHFQDPRGCLAADAFLNGLMWTCVDLDTREKRAHNLVLRVPVFVSHLRLTYVSSL